MTGRAVNMVLTCGTAFSICIGVLYLWVFPAASHPAWPHFLLLSFYIFVLIMLGGVLVAKSGTGRAVETTNAAIVPAKPGRRVWTLWGALTAVMILLYILCDGHTATAQELRGGHMATWIGYPGDFEVWLSNQVQNRRTDRGTFFPPFWKLDSHYILIDFRKAFQLEAADDIRILAFGQYNCKLDGKMLPGAPRQVRLTAGAHTLELKVYNQATPPFLYISGRELESDTSWQVTFEDKEWIDATGKASDKSGTVWVPAAAWGFDDPAMPPSHWHLNTVPEQPESVERGAHSMLVDFGRETFGYVRLLGLRGRGRLSLYYGESKEEALSTDSCETLDHIEVNRPAGGDSL